MVERTIPQTTPNVEARTGSASLGHVGHSSAMQISGGVGEELIPIVNIVVWILALAGLAANFGKGGGLVVGLLLLPFIFYPILGFGSAEYTEGAGADPRSTRRGLATSL